LRIKRGGVGAATVPLRDALLFWFAAFLHLHIEN